MDKSSLSSPELYHFMLLENFKSLVESEEFILGPWHNLSMTVRKDLMKNCQHCRLNIDYEELEKDGYRVEKYDSSHKDGVDFEEEFRVTVEDAKIIPNFLKYIINVCIFTSDKLFGMFIENKFGEQNFIDLLDLCENKNIDIIEE